jgi:hypothetical protein
MQGVVQEPCQSCPHCCGGSQFLSVASGNPRKQVTQLSGVCTCLGDGSSVSEVGPSSDDRKCTRKTGRKGVIQGQSCEGLEVSPIVFSGDTEAREMKATPQGGFLIESVCRLVIECFL